MSHGATFENRSSQHYGHQYRGIHPFSHSNISWSTLGSPPQGGVQIQMPEPSQLGPLDVEEQQLYSELLPGGRGTHPITMGVPRHPF